MENRVLVFMPTGRDASLVCATLEKADISALACEGEKDLGENLQKGAGTLLIAEEALKNGTLEYLVKQLNKQPVWSDIPVVLFAGNAGKSEELLELVGSRFNATIVERPIRMAMFISAVRGALRAREKQYQTRDLLTQLEEADHQKDLFLATLSHELRTPLNSMLGWIELLRKDVDSPVHVNRGLDVIERNAKSQSKVIADILFLSRVVTGKLELKPKRINLFPVVRAAVDAVIPSIKENELTIETNFEIENDLIEGDAERLQQVFLNLLSNAIKFTPPGGKISVSVKKDDASIKVEVKDTGKGIKPEFLPYVFERFRQADSSFTREAGGLGLGLAIVRHLVELHGGEVGVESDGRDKGATFMIFLPVPAEEAKEEESADQISKDKSSVPLRSLEDIHILLVEDDADSREMLQIMFEQYNIKTTAVDTAAKALEKIKEMNPDLLISDVGLPGEDGYELIQKVRTLPENRGGKVPAIALTGYASLQDRKQALKAGYQEHLAKPVDIDKLLGFVKSLVIED